MVASPGHVKDVIGLAWSSCCCFLFSSKILEVTFFWKFKMSIGIPIKLLHEAEGHIITLESTTGEVYRGKLLEAEDNMNCQMQTVTVTTRDGRVTQVEQVFIRESMIRFFFLPDMLKNAPMFKTKMGSRGMLEKKCLKRCGLIP